MNTEAVMMALAPKMGRGAAHDKLSKICLQVSAGKGRLIDLFSKDTDITKIFDRESLEKLLDPDKYLGSCGIMVDRVLAAR